MKVTSNRFAGSVAPRRKPLRYGEKRTATTTTGKAIAIDSLSVTPATPAAAWVSPATMLLEMKRVAERGNAPDISPVRSACTRARIATRPTSVLFRMRAK